MRTQIQKDNREKVIRFLVTNDEFNIIKECSLLEKKTMSKYIRTNLNL